MNCTGSNCSTLDRDKISFLQLKLYSRLEILDLIVLRKVCGCIVGVQIREWKNFAMLKKLIEFYSMLK